MTRIRCTRVFDALCCRFLFDIMLSYPVHHQTRPCGVDQHMSFSFSCVSLSRLLLSCVLDSCMYQQVFNIFSNVLLDVLIICITSLHQPNKSAYASFELYLKLLANNVNPNSYVDYQTPKLYFKWVSIHSSYNMHDQVQWCVCVNQLTESIE